MSALRRKLGYAAAAFVLLLFVVPAQASAQGFFGDVYGGIGIPASSDISDFFDIGFSGGVGGGLMFSQRLGVRGDAAGMWLGLKSEFEEGGSSETLKLYSFGGSIVFRLTDPATSAFVAEIAAGGGITSSKLGDEDSETDLTIYPDVTLGYSLGSSAVVFVRGRWYLIFVDSEGDEDASSTESALGLWAGIGIRP